MCVQVIYFNNVKSCKIIVCVVVIELHRTNITNSWSIPSVLASTSLEVLSARKAEIWSSLDEKTQAVYGRAYLEQLYTNFETQVPTYPADVSPVVAAMRTALFSKRPKSRYAVGQGTCTLMYLMLILPCWISDRLSMALSTTSHDACPAKLQQQQQQMTASVVA